MKHLSKAIVINNGKVLVQETRNASKGKVLDFPGGEIRSNESGTDAAARKLFAETKIENLPHTATFSGVNERGGRTYYAIFKADEKAELTASISNDSQAYHWIAPQDIPLNDFYAADAEFIQTHLKND
ncbi:NUDIX hydrolase [Vibrio sp. TBV020]|uniref:NUDIX hydrolase n=1 Tax=Vibrio sp. TBV020 TaxID=3137398 RepID=UPI0038CD96B4